MESLPEPPGILKRPVLIETFSVEWCIIEVYIEQDILIPITATILKEHFCKRIITDKYYPDIEIFMIFTETY